MSTTPDGDGHWKKTNEHQMNDNGCWMDNNGHWAKVDRHRTKINKQQRNSHNTRHKLYNDGGRRHDGHGAKCEFCNDGEQKKRMNL
jgi:hypothetical protein